MADQGVDIFFVGPSPNMRYLTGYTLHGDERLLLLVLPVRGAPFILTNALYRLQTEVLPVPDLVCWTDGEDPFALLKGAVEKRDFPRKKAALEPKLPAFFSVPLQRTFSGSECVLGSSLTEPIRQRKDSAELDLIRRACAQADISLSALIARGGDFWVGKTERDFHDELAASMRAAGLEACDSIVAVGANAATPHHVTGDTIIQRGKGLLVDFWGSLDGYFTDCTRTFFVGESDEEFKRVHALVREANLAAEAKALPGNALGDVDAAAREVITRGGYGGQFTHRTGHGIGIEEHEGAGPSPREKTPIEPGMVFSIEPGIYLPGSLGVRIENLVAIGKDGPEGMHKFQRSLRVL
jgi:Xaa-Pro aminopeptidase